MKKKILVDMDGVLADVYRSMIEKEYLSKGKYVTAEDLNGLDEYEAFPNAREIIKSEKFFRNLSLMPDSIEGLKYLNEKYDVLIVSSATEFSGCINDKQNWLEEHFPFIKWQQMIFCGKKDSVMGDIMIDDHPKNLDYFKGEKIIFSQPHNIFKNKDGYRRVGGWNDIIKIL